MDDNKFYNVTITERSDMAPDLWRIRVRFDGPFSFAPGQYATLGVPSVPRPIERPYSIVSAPEEQGLEFFFELVPNGDLTPHLYKLHVGDSMLMRKVSKGRFTLQTAAPGRTNHFLVCTVTGIAPYVSYVRHLMREYEEGRFKGEHKLFILNGASRNWEFGYREEMEKAAASVPWLKYVATVSRCWECPDWCGELGRVDELVRHYAREWQLAPENTTSYLCGHPDMISNVKGILQRNRFPKEAIKEEIYWIPEKQPQKVAA